MNKFQIIFFVGFSINAINAFDLEVLKPKHIDPIEIDIIDKRLPNEQITNGWVAEHGQFPYQVGLAIDIENNQQVWCGGSLISDQWIITAAHCTDVAIGLTVVLGAQNITNLAEVEQQRIYIQKKQIYVHEEWNPSLLQNDIALIQLPVPIDFNEHIQPINLPKWSATNDYPLYVGKAVSASGWGKDSDSSKIVSPVLRYVEVSVLGQFLCNIRYFGVIKKTHICMKTTGSKSTCNGDSGGPLATLDQPPTLIGVTSFGIVCGCEFGWPSVFTRITSYLEWIHEKSGLINN